MAQGTILDWAALRRLATQAKCDPRTIAKVARGEKVVGFPAERARKVLEKEGIAPGAGAAPPAEAPPAPDAEPQAAAEPATEQKAGA